MGSSLLDGHETARKYRSWCPQGVHDRAVFVKNISRKLCEVATYQAQEHINKVAKVSDGMVGIPQRDSTRDQWCLAYNKRAQLLDGTLSMFGLQLEDVNNDWSHRETGPSGRKSDDEMYQSLSLNSNDLEFFSHAGGELLSRSTNDVAPEDVKTQLLTAGGKGDTLDQVFVASRLMDKTTDLYSKLPQSKAKTLGSMYKVNVPIAKDKQKAVNQTET